MIHVQGLSKRFGEVRAVDDVSFEIRRGEIYGLIGPNGAGKTTTLSMLAGLSRPDGGRIRVDDLDLAADPIAVKRRLGVVPQEVALYEELSGRENLRFWGSLSGLKRGELNRAVDAALERVGLFGKADHAVKTYSGGMKRRLNLSLGLVHSPAVVLMDEPTVGIDPQARLNILDVVEGITASGTTVLYTTHYLEEAERLCDRVGIMDHGRILAEGTVDELKRMVGDGDVVTVEGSFEPADLTGRLTGIDGAQVVSSTHGRLVLSTSGGGTGTVRLLTTILGGSVEVEGISIQPPSLNGLFLKLTGRELRD